MKAPFDTEIRDLESRYWDAIQHKDGATVTDLTDDTCITVDAQGVRQLDAAQIGTMLDQANYELQHFEIADRQYQVRQIADDVVILAYEVHEDVVVDGTPESLDAFDASVWVRRDGAWKCALHTESLKGDPFGRQNIDRLTM